MMDIEEIKRILPHRPPFLLIDRIVDVKEGSSITAIKNVTYNEPFFAGHFPHKAVMPGVLIVEAMAQAGGVLCFLSLNEKRPTSDRVVYFMGIEKARFRKPVVPGDSLKLKVNIIKRRGNIWKIEGKAFVEEDIVAEAIMMAQVV
ncbi:MAG: 3-hydroxyacyl-ACP dehydratase FabZ [Deltaproteobacteria bacterium]|nr:3-hydroxyacyl-ACP dehydratase FabZ [Deltaproteobacteria bacterium]